jgi:hypothetical protein
VAITLGLLHHLTDERFRLPDNRRWCGPRFDRSVSRSERSNGSRSQNSCPGMDGTAVAGAARRPAVQKNNGAALGNEGSR